MSPNWFRRLRVRAYRVLAPIPVPMTAPLQRDVDALLERRWRQAVRSNESKRQARKPQLELVDTDLPMFLRRQAI